MKTGIWYRGIHLTRIRVGYEWSEMWRAGNGDVAMTWNQATAWADSVAIEPDDLYNGEPLFCGVCGDRELLHYHDRVQKVLLRWRMCHRCNCFRSWMAAREADPGSYFVAHGTCFYIKPDEKPGYRGFVGHGWRRFVVAWSDGRRTTTRNLWNNGTVPREWREQLPDTAQLEGWA